MARRATNAAFMAWLLAASGAAAKQPEFASDLASEWSSEMQQGAFAATAGSTEGQDSLELHSEGLQNDDVRAEESTTAVATISADGEVTTTAGAHSVDVVQGTPEEEAVTSTLPSTVHSDGAVTSTLPSGVPEHEAVTSTLPPGVPEHEAVTSTLPPGMPEHEAVTSTLPPGVPVHEAVTSTLPKPTPEPIKFVNDDDIFRVIASHPTCAHDAWLNKVAEKDSIVTQQKWYCFFQVADADRNRHVSMIEWSQVLELPLGNPGRIFALLASPGLSDEPLSFTKRTVTLDKMALGFANADTSGNYELTSDEFREFFGEFPPREPSQVGQAVQRGMAVAGSSRGRSSKMYERIPEAKLPYNDDRIFDIMAEEGTDCHAEGCCPETVDLSEFNCFIETMDTDRDHVVTHSEWTAFLNQTENGAVGRIWLTMARQTPDYDFGTTGAKLALEPDEMQLAFSYADADGDYMVSRQEFVSYFGVYPTPLEMKQGLRADVACMNSLAELVDPHATAESHPNLPQAASLCFRVCKDTSNFCESVQRAGQAMSRAFENATISGKVNDARMTAYCPGHDAFACAAAHPGRNACGGIFEAMFGEGADKAIRGQNPWLPEMLSHCAAAAAPMAKRILTSKEVAS